MQKSMKILALAVTMSCIAFKAESQSTQLVYCNDSKELIYKSDPKGNQIPDFSHVGYRNGEHPIPFCPVVVTLNPVPGDNLSQIQSAIQQVEARQPDANGLRGAVLLKAGRYPVNGTIFIKAGGVVLLGEGAGQSGTHLVATLREKHDFIQFRGSGSASAISSSAKKVKGYVPIGATAAVVESGHEFSAGDDIFLERRPNQKWIELLGMHLLTKTDPEDTNWTPAGYVVRYKRKVTAVKGDTILMDAPVVDPVDPEYAEAWLMKYSWNGKIEHVGIENLRIISEFSGQDDENHGWNAIKFDNVENGWVRNIEAFHFGNGAVNIGGGASHISVLDSKSLDPVSQTTGGRKYSFSVDGQRNLVKNCFTRGGRHDYVTGSKTAGPNVFVESTAVDQKSDIGPHHRWATGLLFDNIAGDGQMNVQNRLNSGSGHGWAGAQTLFWNSLAKSMVVQDPPGDHVNWAIGVKTTGSSSLNNGKYPDGHYESHGTFVVPANLYEAQLALRLNHKKSPPEKPGNLRGERSGSRSVILSWHDNSAEEYAFIIEQSNDNGITWTVVGRVSPDVTAFEAENLTTGVSSLFRVKAKNAYGDSPYSETFQYSDTDGLTGTNLNSSVQQVNIRVYPNPVSGKASVTFSLNKAESVMLALYDIRGSEHSTLFGGYLKEGLHQLDLHLGDKKAGFYIIRLLAQESTGSKIISLN
jgi:hypothetical protein